MIMRKRVGLYSPEYEHDSCGVGFVAHIKGVPSHQMVTDAEHLLCRMDHRGASGSEVNTGDGVGILVGFPEEFFRGIAQNDFVFKSDQSLLAVGNVFLPEDENKRNQIAAIFESLATQRGLKVIGWRKVPIDPKESNIGKTARDAMPKIMQIFVSSEKIKSPLDFDRELYLIRVLTAREVRQSGILNDTDMLYFCSLSCRTIVYKGMLTPSQLSAFYLDLKSDNFKTHLAMVHSRFSTNTFPSWDRAHPYRMISHNGEINTLRGNVNWMSSRQGNAASEYYKDDLESLFPVVDPNTSDSGSFDNVLEFLVMNGRTPQEAVMMMVPEAWQKKESMDVNKRAFYEYSSCKMEAWDGPASIVFTNGSTIGAVLDRNGLRPSRYYVTTDDRVIMASEVGVVPVDPKLILHKGRLEPGKMFLLDFDQGRLISDDELKRSIYSKHPYSEWLKKETIPLSKIITKNSTAQITPENLFPLMRAFGYTSETMQFMLMPLVKELRDPVGSMGNDASMACLSDQPRLVYDYFKQLFAQVTNPPIDSIREEIIMSLESYIGPEKNLLADAPEHCNRLRIRHPILKNNELASLSEISHDGWATKKVDITYDQSEKSLGLKKLIERVCLDAEASVDSGVNLVILSDRGVGKDRIAISALLACGAIHQHLVKKAKRTQVGLIVETGEAREVHHHCLLIGFGADAINPYLAFESLWQAKKEGLLDKSITNNDEAVACYRKGVAKGILKVMAKMGISTLQSYKGAQIFEALGLNEEVMKLCFDGTASRLQGVGFDILQQESFRRYALGFNDANREPSELPNVGEFHWRAGGEVHAWNPNTISKLQLAAKTGDRTAYKEYAQLMNDDAEAKATLRGLLEFKFGVNGPELPIGQVESVANIVRRFCTGAMSLGSLSSESHETLAIAMNRMGGKSNTGEGGEDPERYNPMPSGDSRRSSIKQVASGRFGVNLWYLINADEIQIKMAQGAKPGEGGELPGKKVDDFIARIRYSTPGVGLISPPPHHDIYSIEDLAQLIHDLKNANPNARISVKLVSEVGVGTIAAGVSKAHAEHILISGDSGGTGASPLTSIKHAGLPWELGLAETHQTLVLNDLRSRVVLQADGGLRTGKDVVIAALLGAEEMGFSTAPLIAMGCIMMRKCHLNTCPVGIATQDPALRKKFQGLPEHVVNYLYMVAEEAREIMAKLGFFSINEMIGRVDALETKKAIEHWKADGLDLSPILHNPSKIRPDAGIRQTIKQDHELEKALDNEFIRLAAPALERGEKVNIELPISNTNRTVGTMLSHQVAKKYGERGLPRDTIHIKLDGSAGQSFGAFLSQGVTLELEGDANDYVGKGLSGGRIIIYPPGSSTFIAEENVIIGNVTLYGATAGRAYLRGKAAERFCVRNSGAKTVIEGVGDHGCEYMTGGRVVILGETGINFAAGMSGGIAYVWNPDGGLEKNCNLGTVDLDPVEEDNDIAELFELIERHFMYTKSLVAKKILDQWPSNLDQFTKVMPTDYKRVLEERKRHDEEIEATMHDDESESQGGLFNG
jgi:glutamate synthase (NADPH/NADH) large chain